jgi:DNA-binding transcriptional MerR regulator
LLQPAVQKVLTKFLIMAAQTQFAFDFDSLPPVEKKPEAVTATVIKEEVAVTVTTVATEDDIIDLTVMPAAKPKKKNNKQQTRGRMSLKDMDAGVDLIEVPEDDVLFEKMYYPIGTVAGMFKVNHSLIRFWENEFDILKPKKNGKGDRLFRPEDVKNLKLIYHLLRERKYTIEGAKEFLKNNVKKDEKFAMIESLKKLKNFLTELKANL